MNRTKPVISETTLEFYGRGFLVTLGIDGWSSWAWIRFSKPIESDRSIVFGLVTGGEQSQVVVEQIVQIEKTNERGVVIRLPSALTCEVLERLYVCIKSRQD